MSTQDYHWPEGDNWLDLDDRGLGDRVIAQVCRGMDARYYAMFGHHIDWAGGYPDLVDEYTLSNPTGTAYEHMEWGPPDSAIKTNQHWIRHTPLVWCGGWMYLTQAANNSRHAGGTIWVWDDPAQTGQQRYVLPAGFVALNQGAELFGGGLSLGPNFTLSQRWRYLIETMRAVINSLHTQFSTTFTMAAITSTATSYLLNPAAKQWFPAPTFGRWSTAAEHAFLVAQADASPRTVTATLDGSLRTWMMENSNDRGRCLCVYDLPPSFVGHVEMAWNNAFYGWHGGYFGYDWVDDLVFSDSFVESVVFGRAIPYTPYVSDFPPYHCISAYDSYDDLPRHGRPCYRYPLSDGAAPLVTSEDPGSGLSWNQGCGFFSPTMDYIEVCNGARNAISVYQLVGPSGSFTVSLSLHISVTNAGAGRRIQVQVSGGGVSHDETITGTVSKTVAFTVAYTGSAINFTVTLTDLDAGKMLGAGSPQQVADLMPWKTYFTGGDISVAVVGPSSIEVRTMSDPREHEHLTSDGWSGSGSAVASLSVASWS